jgi:hypothetical protein
LEIGFSHTHHNALIALAKAATAAPAATIKETPNPDFASKFDKAYGF